MMKTTFCGAREIWRLKDSKTSLKKKTRPYLISKPKDPLRPFSTYSACPLWRLALATNPLSSSPITTDIESPLLPSCILVQIGSLVSTHSIYVKPKGRAKPGKKKPSSNYFPSMPGRTMDSLSRHPTGQPYHRPRSPELPT